MKTKYVFGLFAFLFFVAFASAQIPTFHQFYGDIYYANGTPYLGSGWLYTFVNGNITSLDSFSNGTYGYNSLYFVEGFVGYNNSVIGFYVDGHFVTNQTFIEEGTTNLDLYVNFSSGGLVCIDEDGDNFNLTGGDCGPIDCNDQNAAVYPGRSEDCGTGYDDNCNGLANEGCSSSSSGGSSSSSTSSGGGGGLPYFSLDKNLINITVEQGGSASATFTISNPTTSTYEVYVSPDIPWVKPDKVSFTLDAGQSRTITITASPDGSVPIDSYVDNIKVWSNYDEEYVSASINVESAESIFDVSIKINPEDLNIWPGETLTASFLMTRIVPVSAPEPVTVKYLIKDKDDNEVLSFEEVRQIQNEDGYVKDFELPAQLEYGDYVLYSQISYNDGTKTASSSEWFDVGPQGLDSMRVLIIIIILGIAIVSIIIVIIIHRRRLGGHSGIGLSGGQRPQASS